MNAKMFCRILDKRAVIIYFSVIFILLITNTKDMSVIGILGGMNAAGALNVLGVMKWNVCVFPPVAVSTLFMMTEMGLLSKYTMGRSKSVKYWFAMRANSVVAANFAYFLTAFFVTSILTCKFDVRGDLFYRLMIIFPLHTIMLSMLSIMLLAICRTPKPVIIAYLIIEGITAVIGCLFPSVSRFMLAYWGMACSNNLLFANPYFHFPIVVSFMLVFTVISIYITVKFLITNNPAANASNF